MPWKEAPARALEMFWVREMIFHPFKRVFGKKGSLEMAPYKTRDKRSAKIGFVGTNHQLGINSWRERLPLSWGKKHQQGGDCPCAALQESCGISAPPAPASEGLLMQIRAVLHMYDPEISASRANPRHGSYNVMS